MMNSVIEKRRTREEIVSLWHKKGGYKGAVYAKCCECISMTKALWERGVSRSKNALLQIAHYLPKDRRRYSEVRVMSESKVVQAMVAVMGDISHVGKDQNNQQQGFKYRGIDDIYNALHGLMAKHGLISVPTVLEKERSERTTRNGGILLFTCLRIKYTFYATDGSFIECTVEGEGMDSGDKSSNKAMAVGHKYALLQAFCIPTDEVKDPDAESHEIVKEMFSKQQKATFDELLNGEPLNFWLYLQTLPDESKLALYSSFEKGSITAMKKQARDLESKGSVLFSELSTALKEYIDSNDASGVAEISLELGDIGKRMAFKQLNPQQQKQVKELAGSL